MPLPFIQRRPAPQPTPSPAPPPPPPPPPTAPPASPAPPPPPGDGAPSGEFLSCRVRLVVEVADHAEERNRAIALLRAQEGWQAEQAGPGDGVTPGPGRSALVVDVWRKGARLGARARTEQEVHRLGRRSSVTLCVVDSVLVRREPHRPATVYKMHRLHSAPRGLGWAYRLWRDLGGFDLPRSLKLPGVPDRLAARAEFQRRALGTTAFDPLRHDIRVVHAPSPAVAAASAASQRHATGAAVAAGSLGVLVMLLGLAAVRLTHEWRLVPLGLAALLSWPAGLWMTSHTSCGRPARLVIGMLTTGTCLFVGTQLSPVVASGAGRLPVAAGIDLLLGFCGYGCCLAVRSTWLSRNASWVAPALLTVLPLALPWVGGLLDEVYLRDGFGIPASAVPVAGYLVAAAGLKPVLIAAGSVVCLVGLAGWLRHFHITPGLGGLTFLYGPLICVLYVATALLFGLQGAESAAQHAAQAARTGRTPDDYYGIQGRLMCLEPVTSPIPVFNGPLPTDHPVLVFNPGSDPLWVWDPHPARGTSRNGSALSLPAPDVSVVSATGTGGCPKHPH